MDSNATLTVLTDHPDDVQATRGSPTQYVLLETPMREYLRQDKLTSDAEVISAEPSRFHPPAVTSDAPVPSRPAALQTRTLDDDVAHANATQAHTDRPQRTPGDVTEHTMQLSSMELRDSTLPILPARYLNRQFQSNSYFSCRLLRLAQVIVLGDLVALGFFYFYESNGHSRLYVGSPLTVLVNRRESSCTTSLALAALVYHLFPAVFILGLPASGFRVFEPFRREQRIDPVGRLQKVKRTVCLQVCELVGVAMFLYEALLLGFVVYYVASGRIFGGCDATHVSAHVFCGCAIVMFWLLVVLMRAFARFREHIKMQLGAFKESDQTGDVKAQVVRARLKRKKKRHAANHGKQSASVRPLPVARSILIQDVKKRLFRGAQLGDLKLLRRSIRMAQAHLGNTFAHDLYPDPVLVFGLFGRATKNPLHVAAYQGNIAAMELLYHAHFRVNALDKVSRWRLSTGDLFWSLAHYFIAKPVVAADETYRSVLKTTLVTPLHCAVSTGRLAAVQWLLAHGADVNLCSKSSYRCESRLPPIFLADHPDLVHVLLRAGANHLAIPDPGHMNTLTVLQLAYLRGNYAVAQVLEDWGGDVALTPLHAAAALNDAATIRSLLRQHVQPNVLGELGYVGLNQRTPLHWAAVNGAVQALEILLAAKANANFQDAHGRTALHWAARVNRLDSVRVLLAHGADPTIVDDGHMTPIMCAACAGGTSVAMFQVLVARGCDINHPRQYTGDTALHLAVKLDDQPTALALLSMGGDLMRTNAHGFRPLDCTTSTRLQFEIKRAAGTRDVMISYTHSHLDFVLKIRQSLENAHITVWLDLMDPSGIGGGSVWREEIARGITKAAVVLCILTEDYAQSDWCLKELALAKQVGTPILAISTEHAAISEEVQVYLYTRQLVPFERAIVKVEHVQGSTTVRYEYDEVAYEHQLRMLLDGLRDIIEKRKEDQMKRTLRQATTTPGSASTQAGRSHRLQRAGSGLRSTNTYGMDSIKFDERNAALNPPMHVEGSSDSTSPCFDEHAGDSVMPNMLYKRRPCHPHPSVCAATVRPPYESSHTNLSVFSTTSSSSSYTDDSSVSESIVLDTGGYYCHRPGLKNRRDLRSDTSSTRATEPTSRDSRVENLHALNLASARGEQFVFISHGDYHQRFVHKLCVTLCRDGGLRCYVDRKHVLERASTIEEDKEEELDKTRSTRRKDKDMAVRIHDAKEAILQCSAFVLLVSEKTLKSELVKDQLAFAEDKGKTILPVVVNRATFSLDVKYTLARSEFFHFFTKGDMMGFHHSSRHLLTALRREVYGIPSRSPLPKCSRCFNAAQCNRGGSYSTASDVHRYTDVRDSTMSTNGSIHASLTMEGSVRRRRVTAQRLYRRDPSSFALYPPRLSQTFSITSGTTHSMSSELSLSHSMIGNFSTLVGRVSDDFDEEDGFLSFAGIQDDDFESDDEIEMGKDGMVHVVHDEASASVLGTIRQYRPLDAPKSFETCPRESDSSISILELTELSDPTNIGCDVMLGDKTRAT